MSNKGRDRATQLVEAEVSVYFTKHTLLLLAREYEETAQTFSLYLQERYRTIGVAENNTIVAIEILSFASRRLPTTETSQRLVQRSSVSWVHHLSRNSGEPAGGGYLHGKEIHACIAIVMQKILSKRESHTQRRAHTASSRARSTQPRTQHRVAHVAPSKAHTPSTACHHTSAQRRTKKQKTKNKNGFASQARARDNDDASARTNTIATTPMT